MYVEIKNEQQSYRVKQYKKVLILFYLKGLLPVYDKHLAVVSLKVS